MKKIFFTKMQGLGNDFVILDWEEYQEIGLPLDVLAKSMCERKFGVGADGLIVVVPEADKADLGWLFYNAAGTVAEMSDHAMRCFAKYALNKGYVDKEEFLVEVGARVVSAKINTDGTVTLNYPIACNESTETEKLEGVMTGPAEFSFEGVFFYK